MFDLFRSRAKAVRIMLGAMLGVIALSMLVYLIPGTGITAADSSSDQVVAEIGKSTVTVGEVQQQVQKCFAEPASASRVSPLPIIPQLVDQAIAERAVAYEAEQLGFRVSDRDLADYPALLPVWQACLRTSTSNTWSSKYGTHGSGLRRQRAREEL